MSASRKPNNVRHLGKRRPPQKARDSEVNDEKSSEPQKQGDIEPQTQEDIEPQGQEDAKPLNEGDVEPQGQGSKRFNKPPVEAPDEADAPAHKAKLINAEDRDEPRERPTEGEALPPRELFAEEAKDISQYSLEYPTSDGQFLLYLNQFEKACLHLIKKQYKLRSMQEVLRKFSLNQAVELCLEKFKITEADVKNAYEKGHIDWKSKKRKRQS